MSGHVDANELETLLLVDDRLAPFPLRARIWHLVRAIREDRDPEYLRYGASCQVFPLEDGDDLTHLEVPVCDFKVVFTSHTEGSVTVSLWKDFREVFDDRQLNQIAEFSAEAVAVLRKVGAKAMANGEGIEQLEAAAKKHQLEDEQL